MIQDRNNSTEFKDQIRYRSTNLEYHIKRSKRIKTSELIVDSDRIEVRTPLNKSLEDTRNIIRDKAEWILKKTRSSIKRFDSGNYEIQHLKRIQHLPYLGKNYPLKINKNQSRNTLSFVDGEFVVDITNSDDEMKMQNHRSESYMKSGLIRIAYPVLKTKVETYCTETRSTCTEHLGKK